MSPAPRLFDRLAEPTLEIADPCLPIPLSRVGAGRVRTDTIRLMPGQSLEPFTISKTDFP